MDDAKKRSRLAAVVRKVATFEFVVVDRVVNKTTATGQGQADSTYYFGFCRIAPSNASSSSSSSSSSPARAPAYADTAIFFQQSKRVTSRGLYLGPVQLAGPDAADNASAIRRFDVLYGKVVRVKRGFELAWFVRANELYAFYRAAQQHLLSAPAPASSPTRLPRSTPASAFESDDKAGHRTRELQRLLHLLLTGTLDDTMQDDVAAKKSKRASDPSASSRVEEKKDAETDAEMQRETHDDKERRLLFVGAAAVLADDASLVDLFAPDDHPGGYRNVVALMQRLRRRRGSSHQASSC